MSKTRLIIIFKKKSKKDLHNINSHGILNGHSANGPVAQVVRAHP